MEEKDQRKEVHEDPKRGIRNLIMKDCTDGDRCECVLGRKISSLIPCDPWKDFIWMRSMSRYDLERRFVFYSHDVGGCKRNEGRKFVLYIPHLDGEEGGGITLHGRPVKFMCLWTWSKMFNVT